jgi:hypothetical protein
MRTISSVCIVGSEIEVRKLRKKATKRNTIPGMKNLRVSILYLEWIIAVLARDDIDIARLFPGT